MIVSVSCLQSAVHWATSLLSANLRYRACILCLVMSPARGVARSLDCVEIILVGLVSSSLVLTHDLSARCLGSFLTLSFFVLTHIGD